MVENISWRTYLRAALWVVSSHKEGTNHEGYMEVNRNSPNPRFNPISREVLLNLTTDNQ